MTTPLSDSGLVQQKFRFSGGSNIAALALIFCALIVANQITSAAPNPLRITLIPELRVIDPQAKESRSRMVPATTIEQGTEVYYTVRATNESNEKLRNAVIVQAVPVNTRYVDKSATGAGASIMYSINGGKSFISASELRGVMSDSPRNIRVTHIRWQFRHALAPHVTVLARFRVIFD